MFLIKQADTSHSIQFLLTQAADHITALTGATPTVTLSKNGGGFGSAGGTVAEVANGVYKLTPSAGDTGTLGSLVLHATAASGDPTDVVVQVVAFDPFTDPLAMQVPASYSSGSVGYIIGNAASSSQLADAVWDEARSGHVSSGTFGEGTKVAGYTTSQDPATIVWDAARSAHVASGSFGQGAPVSSYNSGQDPATLVLDAAMTSHLSAGTVGAKLNAAGAGGDPLTNAVPGSYAAGTAGYVLGNAVPTVDPLSADVPGSYSPGTAGYALGNGVKLDLAQAVPLSNTAQTVGDALNAARAQGFGVWRINGTTLTLYGADGTTTVRSFTLDSATAPTSRV